MTLQINLNTLMKKEVITMMNRIPGCIEETAGGKSLIPLDTRNLAGGIIYLSGPVIDETAENIITQILYCKERGLPIHLLINSVGGSVTAGLAIYDILRTIGLEINTYCIGIAASMAAVILASGDKGHRYILPHSKVMIHEPLIADGLGGAASSVQRSAEMLLQTKDMLNTILSECTGRKKKEIDEATLYDHFFDAKEAQRFGLIDKIITDADGYGALLAATRI